MSNTKHSPKPATVVEKNPAVEKAQLLDKIEASLNVLSTNVDKLGDDQFFHLTSWVREEKKRREEAAKAKRPKVGDTVVITSGRFKEQRAVIKHPVARKQYMMVQFADDKLLPDVVHVDDMEVSTGESDGAAKA